MSASEGEEFEGRARCELRALLSALDQVGEELEADLEGEVLSIEFGDGSNYLLNLHRAARQLWLAAEHRGWRFDWDEFEKRWVCRKTGEELWTTLASLLGQRLGQVVELRRSG